MSFGGRVFGTTLIVAGGVLAIGVIIGGPRLFRAVRPGLRDGLRHGVRLYDRFRSAAAGLADDVEDLLAEVKAQAREDGDALGAARPGPRAATEA